MLFHTICGGEPYTRLHADSFFDWCVEGWKSEAHFVFFVLDSDKLPVGCCDLKSNDRADCEVGYWCSTHASGVMTNSVAVMLRHASDAGFFGFHAFVRPSNSRSQRLLHRLGFAIAEDSHEEERLRFCRGVYGEPSSSGSH